MATLNLVADYEHLRTINRVLGELERATELHGPMMSSHHAYGVILEEVDEFWDEVKKKRELRSKQKMKEELVQIAAMCCRAIIDLKLDEA